MRVWVCTPLEITLRRLTKRTGRKVNVIEDEARRIWSAARTQAKGRRFDLVVDTGKVGERDLAAAVLPLARLIPT